MSTLVPPQTGRSASFRLRFRFVRACRACRACGRGEAVRARVGDLPLAGPPGCEFRASVPPPPPRGLFSPLFADRHVGFMGLGYSFEGSGPFFDDRLVGFMRCCWRVHNICMGFEVVPLETHANSNNKHSTPLKTHANSS